MRDRKNFIANKKISRHFKQLCDKLPKRIITSKGDVRKNLCPIGSFIVANSYESRFVVDRLIQQHDFDDLHHQLHSLDLQVRSLANESIKATLHKVRHNEIPRRFSDVCYGDVGIASTLHLLHETQDSMVNFVDVMSSFSLCLPLEKTLEFEDICFKSSLKTFSKDFNEYAAEAKILINDCHQMLHSKQ